MEYEFLTETDSETMTEIIECLKNILSVPEGTLPLMRELGINWDVVSDNPGELENEYATEVIEKVETWEPRIAVTSVEFSHNAEGKTTVTLHLEPGDEWDEEEEKETEDDDE